MKQISPRQLHYVQAVCAGKTQLDAARIAGYTRAPKRAAERLSQNLMVIAEIDKARTAIREQTKYGAEAAVKELDAAMTFSRETGNATALARCIELKSKLYGLLIDRVDARLATGFQLVISGLENPAIETVEPDIFG